MALKLSWKDKPILGHTKFQVNLKDIISKRDNSEYKSGDSIRSDFIKVGDYNATVQIYPFGCKPDSNDWSIYLYFIPKSNDISVEFTVRCGDDMLRFNKDAKGWTEAASWGWKQAFTQSQIIEEKCIFVEIKIFDEEQLQSKKPINYCKLYKTQQKLFYENSKNHGDITLIIQKEQIDDNVIQQQKRRRINEDDIMDNDDAIDHYDNNEEMKVSGNILKSSSKVFAGMLEHEFKENNESRIVITAINTKDVDDMYYYICTNELRKDVNPITLIKLAHLYDLKSLFHACSNRISYTLSVDNYIEAANAFNRYEIAHKYHKLVEFGKKHLKQIEKKDNFNNLAFSFKFGILGWRPSED